MRPSPRVDHHALLFCALAVVLVLPRLGAEVRPVLLDFGEAHWPSHPTLLFARYRGERFPVVAAEKDQPVVVIDGKRKTLSASTPLVTQLAPDFAAEHVEFTGGFMSSKRAEVHGTPHFTPLDAQVQSGTVTLRSAQDLPDCYLVITSFNTAVMDPESDDFCKTLIVEIGTLRAAEARDVPFSMKVVAPLSYSNGDPSKKYDPTDVPVALSYWQLFSHGVEIRTNSVSDVEARTTSVHWSSGKEMTLVHVTGIGLFFYLHERAEHESAVEAWRKENRSGNHFAQPYAQTPLQAGPSEGLPKEASAILSVSAEGKVTQVVLEQAFPEDAAQRLTRCLKLWLFLPAIKNGSAVATRIRVPLEF